MQDQLDIKRKMKARIGDKILVRLRFERQSFAGADTTKQYEMLPLNDNRF